MDIQSVIIVFLPLIYLFIYTLSANKRDKINRIPIWSVVLLLLVLCATMATVPNEQGDRLLYKFAYERYRSFEITPEDAKDYGWGLFNIICGKFIGDNITIFFLIVAFFYVSSYFILAKKYIKKQYIGCFVLLSVGALGFKGYGDNTLRAGFALAILYYSICFDKRILKVVLLIVSVSIHKSMIIPIASYLLAYIIQSKKYTYYIWFLCLAISIVNVDLSGLFERFGFLDERVDSYIGSLETGNSLYAQGFRIDFVIYSIFPMVIEYFYSQKLTFIKEAFYSRVFRTYLVANAIWLLVIRIAFTDRVAYLSWFMIPFIVLYPVLNYPQKFKHPQSIVLYIMYTLIGINVFLSSRSIIPQNVF